MEQKRTKGKNGGTHNSIPPLLLPTLTLPPPPPIPHHNPHPPSPQPPPPTLTLPRIPLPHSPQSLNMLNPNNQPTIPTTTYPSPTTRPHHQPSKHTRQIPTPTPHIQHPHPLSQKRQQRLASSGVHMRSGNRGRVAYALRTVAVGFRGAEVGAVDLQHGLRDARGCDEGVALEGGDEGGVGGAVGAPGHGCVSEVGFLESWKTGVTVFFMFL